tara:strand:- start:523 stop:939 length:417 start_codon:yes stop_codon:yes gene_type:complete
MECTVLRYFNVYGPREPTKGLYSPVVGLFKRQIRQGRPITIVGDGSQRRDFTYVSDVVLANIAAMKEPFNDKLFEIYNVGTGKNYSINEIANLLNAKNIVYINDRPAEVKETLADIAKTINNLKWKPKYTLEQKIMSY